MECWSCGVVENGKVVWQSDEQAHPFSLQARDFIAAVRAADPARVKSSYATALNSLAAVLGANASADRGGEMIHLPSFVGGAK